jgi:hypothetical protein
LWRILPRLANANRAAAPRIRLNGVIAEERVARKLIWVAIIATLTAWDGAGAQAPAQSDPDTKPANVQLTKNPRIEHVDAHGAVIAWSTNVNAGTMVRYGTAPNHLDKTAQMRSGGKRTVPPRRRSASAPILKRCNRRPAPRPPTSKATASS